MSYIGWVFIILLRAVARVVLLIIFFFQETSAYEMRISDWSSDVCSSDLANFWRAPTLADGASKLEKNSAYRQVVEDGLRANEEHNKLTDPVEAHDWMHGTLERSQNHINSKLNGGLAFLATVGSTAPFVGLLGKIGRAHV